MFQCFLSHILSKYCRIFKCLIAFLAKLWSEIALYRAHYFGFQWLPEKGGIDHLGANVVEGCFAESNCDCENSKI